MPLNSRVTFTIVLAGVAFAAGTMIIVAWDLVSATVGAVLLGGIAILWCSRALPQLVRMCGRVRRSLTWWHWLWLAAFASSQVFRIRDTDSIVANPIDVWALYRVGLVLLVAAVLCLRMRVRSLAASMWCGLIAPLTLFTLISAASTLWSVNPTWTLYKSCEFAVDVALMAAMLMAIRTSEGSRRFLDWIWLIVGGLVVTVWAGVVLWPDEALVPGGESLGSRIAGVLPVIDQNSVGEYGAVLAIVAIARLLARPVRDRATAAYGAIAAVGLVTLTQSQTRAALIGFLLALSCVVILSGRRIAIAAFSGAAIAITAAITFTWLGDWIWAAFLRNDHPVGLESLSGRVPRWDASWASFLERPLLGYGAYAAQRFAIASTTGDSALTDVLNTYLDVLTGTGLLGLVPLLVVIAGAWWYLVRASITRGADRLERAAAVECIGVLAIQMARSVVSTKFVTHSTLLGLVVVGYAEYLRRHQKSMAGVRAAEVGPNASL